MRSPEDALRSLRRFVGEVLGPDYDVQFVRTEELERPGAVVRRIGPVPNTGSAYVRDLQADFEIFIYPPGAEGDPAFSLLEAERIAGAMDRAVSSGHKAAGARAMRIPVWDYDDIPADEGTPEGALPYDFLCASNLRTEPRVDPEDDSLFTVVVDVRLEWRADGDTSRYEGAILTDVGVHYRA